MIWFCHVDVVGVFAELAPLLRIGGEALVDQHNGREIGEHPHLAETSMQLWDTRPEEVVTFALTAT